MPDFLGFFGNISREEINFPAGKFKIFDIFHYLGPQLSLICGRMSPEKSNSIHEYKMKSLNTVTFAYPTSKFVSND